MSTHESEIGAQVWAIAEGYIPKTSTGPQPDMLSHETVCLLNTTDHVAEVEITIYFSDRDPAGPFRATIKARRTLHLRFNDLSNPERLPLGIPYSSVIRSSVPIVVQHTRLDSRQAANALLSTMAYAVPSSNGRPL